MRLPGQLSELNKVLLRTTTSGEEVTLQAPASLSAGNVTFTFPDVPSDTFVMLTATQSLTNKTFVAPTITSLSALTMPDNGFTLQDNATATKQLRFNASGITTGTTRTLTAPDANTTIVGTDTAQILLYKTLTAPILNTWSRLQAIPNTSVDAPDDDGEVNLFYDSIDKAVKYKIYTGALYGVPSNTPEATPTGLPGTVNISAQSFGGKKTFTVASGDNDLTVDSAASEDSRICFSQAGIDQWSMGWDDSASRFRMNAGTALADGVGISVTDTQLTIPNGVVSAPGIAFDSDPNTGIFLGSADTLHIATNAGTIARFSPTQVLIENGSAATPSLSWNGDGNTGFYVTGNNGGTHWSGNGTEGGLLNNLGVRAIAGAAASPSYSFLTDTNTGIYSGGSDAINFSTNGVFRGGFTNNGLRLQNGSVGSPALYFSSDSNTGWYYATDGSWNFASNGSTAVRLANDFIQIGDSTNSTATLRISSNTTSRIQFGDADDDVGRLEYYHTSPADTFGFVTNNIGRATIGTWSVLSTVCIVDGRTSFDLAPLSAPATFYVRDDSSLTGIQMYNETSSTSPALFMGRSDVVGTNVLQFQVQADGDVFSRTNSYTSDARLKTNIQQLSGCLESIKALRGTSFNFISDDANTTHYGLIAQEVETVLPDLIKERDTGLEFPLKTLNSNGLIPVLIEAVKELAARVEALEAQH